jgi:large subunit ribosomal protein L10
MPRPEKVQAVAEIRERIEDAKAVFVTEFRGLTVKQLSQLRRTLSESGADYKVVKMTLARRAVDELGIEGIGEHLVGPSALTFARIDAVATAKVLRDAGRDNEKVIVKAGVLAGGTLMLPEQITKLADIEPRDVLLSKIAGAAKAPMAQAAGLFAAFTRNAATMFSQLLEKKESGGPTGATPEAVAPAAVEPEPDAAGPEEQDNSDTAEPETPTAVEPEPGAPAQPASVTAEPEAEAAAEPEDHDPTDEPAAAAEEE